MIKRLVLKIIQKIVNFQEFLVDSVYHYAVRCGVKGRVLASHTGVRGFEPQNGGRLPSLTVRKYLYVMKKGGDSESTIISRSF